MISQCLLDSPTSNRPRDSCRQSMKIVLALASKSHISVFRLEASVDSFYLEAVIVEAKSAHLMIGSVCINLSGNDIKIAVA